MTIAEAIKELKQLEYYNRPFDNSIDACNKANRKNEALHIAIKALEQEPILDSIAAEMEKTRIFSITYYIHDRFAVIFHIKDYQQV